MAPQASGRTSPSPDSKKRRARAIQSCDLCRKKKIKCDRNDPCASCISKGECCIWQVPPPPPSQTYKHSEELASELTLDEEVICLRRLVRVLSQRLNLTDEALGDLTKALTPQHKRREWSRRASATSLEDGDEDSQHELDELQRRREHGPRIDVDGPRPRTRQRTEEHLPSPALTASAHSDPSPISSPSSSFTPVPSPEPPTFFFGQQQKSATVNAQPHPSVYQVASGAYQVSLPQLPATGPLEPGPTASCPGSASALPSYPPLDAVGLSSLPSFSVISAFTMPRSGASLEPPLASYPYGTPPSTASSSAPSSAALSNGRENDDQLLPFGLWPLEGQNPTNNFGFSITW